MQKCCTYTKEIPQTNLAPIVQSALFYCCIIIIIIHHVSLYRPILASSNSLFKGLPSPSSTIWSIIQHFIASQILTFLILAFVGNMWSFSCQGQMTHRETDPSTYHTGSWMGPKVTIHMAVRIKISAAATKSNWSLITGRGWRFLSAPKHPTCSGAHPATCLMGTGVLTLGTEWLGA